MSSSKNRATIQERLRKKREKEYRRRLKLLEKTGVYQPKADDLSRYRRTRINKEYEAWRQFVDNPRDEFFFVDAAAQLDKRDLAQFISNAKSLSMKATKRGVFLHKEGQRRARIVKDKARDEFDIVLTGKTKWGVNKGKKISDRIPVAPVDHLTDERERLEKMAKAFGSLKKGEAISFVVVENGVETGSHKFTYDTAEGVIRALNQYHKENLAHRLAFFRHVQIRKTTLTDWRKEHPPKQRKKRRRSGDQSGYRPH